jgi:hypothetical protein
MRACWMSNGNRESGSLWCALRDRGTTELRCGSWRGWFLGANKQLLAHSLASSVMLHEDG